MIPRVKRSIRRYPDGWATASLAMIALILFGLFQPGVSTLHGDNLIQNYPLREYVGEMLRRGHLPAWNPYIWSGVPLLAGFNAGAAYPLTWLFVVLPGAWAWTLTLVGLYTLASSGFYFLMRELGRSRWASWIAGATYGFSGFMISQMVHLATVEGVAWVGWIAFFVIRLTKSDTWSQRLKWMTYLGVSAGLVILSGSPEPMAFGAVFAAMTAIYALFGSRTRIWASLLAFAAAGILALLIGAVQWVPGLAFIHISQRHSVSLATFGSMSLPPISWIFFFWPYIHGGYSRFPAPINYTGTFNLPEISGYVGLLPILAALSLAVSKWRQEDRWQLAMFYTWGIVGALLSAGRFTPLETILYHLPFYHGIRAQNRNLFIVDASLVALFAYWLDGIRRERGLRRKMSWRMGVPGVIFAALFLLCLHIGISTNPSIVRYLVIYILLGLVLGVMALVIYFGLPWLSPKRRMQIVTIFTIIDLGLYTGGQYWLNPPPINVATGGPSLSTRMTAIVGTGGRYGIYDPHLGHYPQVEALNEPDLNMLYGLKSFQGYGSLLSARYQTATGAHRQATFNPALLSSGSLVNKLNVTTIFTLPEELVKPVSSHASWSQLHLKSHTAWPTKTHPWFFGTVLKIQQVRLNFPSRSVDSRGVWRVGSLLSSSGKVKWYKPTISWVNSVLTLNLPSPVSTSAIIIRPPHGFALKPVDAVIAAGNAGQMRQFAPNASLTGNMAFPQWRYEGHVGSFAVFHNNRARGWFWLGNQGKVDSIHGDSGQNPNRMTVEVTTPSATRLNWSEAYSPGWTASITHLRTTHTMKVIPGVIQSVKVPKGRSRISFQYREPGLDQGLFLSFAGFLVALILWVVSQKRHWFRKNA